MTVQDANNGSAVSHKEKVRSQIAFCILIAAVYAWFVAATTDAQSGVIIFIIFVIVCGIVVDRRPGTSIKEIIVNTIPICIALFVMLYSVQVVLNFDKTRIIESFMLDAAGLIIYLLISVVALPAIVVCSVASDQITNLFRMVLRTSAEDREGIAWYIKAIALIILTFIGGSVTDISEIISIFDKLK